MREHPILFSAPMVRALLNGSKTQTRRVIKNQPFFDETYVPAGWAYKPDPRSWCGLSKWPNISEFLIALSDFCPFGKTGDQLWVRETFGLAGDENQHVLHYRATHWRDGKDMGWKPSIHMPRWASRITLEITGVRVERLNDCSEADAKAEGILQHHENLNKHLFKNYSDDDYWFTDPVASYKSLWESINGAGSWDANPFVWVIEFEVKL